MKKKASDSHHAVWHDPSTYDPLTMGPPYLPAPKQVSTQTLTKIASVTDYLSGNDPSVYTSVLVGYLRALSFIHQTNHWQAKGPNFYADHELFDRLYTETQPLIDSLAERLIGLFGITTADPIYQAAAFGEVVLKLKGNPHPQPSAEDLVASSLKGVKEYLGLLQEVYTQLKLDNKLTPGLDNLLQSIADTHETFAYLLEQRLSVKTF